MSFFENIVSTSRQSLANFNSVVNKGDIIAISWGGGDEVVKVLDICVDLNNDRILPSEIVLVFIFATMDEQLQETEMRVRMTASQFKYQKHIRYASEKGK